MLATIYVIHNKIDNCQYIGHTTNSLKIRFTKHKSRSKTYNNKFYRHCNTIGWENITISPLITVDCATKEEMNEYEQKYIDIFKPTLNTNRAIKL